MNTLKRWKSSTSTKTAATASSVDSDDAFQHGIPEDAEAGPSSLPAGLEPSPAAGSADKLRLSLLQQSRIVNPGDTLQGRVEVASLKDCKSLRIAVTGKCGCMIMGKMRYQAAIGVNALGGSGYGGAAPVTFRETHSFLTIDKLIWDAEDPDNVDSVANSSMEKQSHTSSSISKQVFQFSIDLPKMKQCTCPAVTYALPPSVDLRHFDRDVGAIDTSTIEVKYSISATLDKKGFLKRKQKVKIPLQIVDDAPPGYSTQEEIRGASRGPFKYASAQESTDVPELECLLSFVPPTTRGGVIAYTVTYRIADSSVPPFTNDNEFLDGLPMSPPPFEGQLEGGGPDLPPLYQSSSAPLLSTVNPRLEVILNRASRTRPIERSREGQEFQWAPMAIAQGKNDSSSSNPNEDNEERNARLGHGELRGVLQIPKDEITMFTCGAEISHFVQARLFSQALKRPITVRCRVYLPSGR